MVKKINKLNLLYFNLVIGLLMFSILVISEPAVPGQAPAGGVNSELTLEQFYQNPSPQNFVLMNPADQANFISTINSFQNPENIQIATDYFINPQNVNENKDTFVKFMKHKGVDFNIAEGKGVTDFSKEGTLKGKNGAIADIYQFSNSNLKIDVDKDGNIILIDNGKKEWAFKGDLSAETSPAGQTVLTINDGEFGDKKIIGANFILDNGVVRGTADSIAGFTFALNENEELPDFEFNREQNILKTANAQIDQISKDSELIIMGENIKLPNNDLIREGGLEYKDGGPVKVLTSSDVVVQGFNHNTYGYSDNKDWEFEEEWYVSELNLFYAENDETLDIDRKEEEELQNVLREGLGEDNKLTFAEMNKEIQEESAKVFDLSAKRNKINVDLEKLREQLYSGSANKEAIFSQIEKLSVESRQILIEIGKAGINRQIITDEYLPLIFKREEIVKKYQAERQEIYDTLIPEIKKNQYPEGIENYFIYGQKKVWLGGRNFDTKVEEGNNIFPEFVKFNEKGVTRTEKSRLEFHPDGGEMEVGKNSRDGQPLALNLKMEGKGKINNGKWEFLIDGNEIKGRTLFDYAPEGTGQGQTNSVSSDMRFEYLTSEGEKKTYDLDVDKTFFTSLSDEERQELLEENKGLTLRFNQINSAMEELKANPEIQKVESKLDEINGKLLGTFDIVSETPIAGLYEEYKYQEGQLARALLTPNDNKQLQEITVNDIKSKMENINQNIFALIKERDELVEGEVASAYYQLRTESSTLGSKIDDNTKRIVVDLGQQKTGAFGQIISSQDGNAKLSYQEFIEGFPLLKNDYVLEFTAEVYKPKKGITVGEEILKVPIIKSSNADSLDLDILNRAQECIDTQFRLAYEYAKATGRNICYNNGETCLSQFEGKEQKFITGWMSGTGTKTYVNGIGKEIKNVGSWSNDIQIVNDYEDIQPGDVILRSGHAIGIKEVIRIPPVTGKKYFKKFAGSQPALSAHVYDDYVSVDELKRDKDTGLNTAVFRWRFLGDEIIPPVSQPVPQLDPISGPSTVPSLETSGVDLPELELPDGGIVIPGDQAISDLPSGKFEVDTIAGDFSESVGEESAILDLPKSPESQSKDVAAVPKDASIQDIKPTPQLDPISVPTTVPSLETSDVDLPELELPDGGIEIPVGDQADSSSEIFEVDTKAGDFSESLGEEQAELDLPDISDTQRKEVAAVPKDASTVQESKPTPQLDPVMAPTVPEIAVSEPISPDEIKLPEPEIKTVEPTIKPPTSYWQQILDESADTTSAINEEMVNTDLVNSELTAPSDLVEIVIPKTKEYTGRELFDNPRCPECTYWIDPETGKFRASQLSEIVTYEEEDYKLYREFKLSKKQIKDLEKAKEKGKFS
ncbi:hypothetical protein HOA91_02250 [Candidatus Woesearchaeota archaeon]|jgi:hypothetical protein|nr:hypothetical protein [Candidatus Woesearchaeota archaeon]